MLKNRTLQLKFVQDQPALPGAVEVPRPAPLEPSEIVEATTMGVVTVIAAYMAADTARQTILHIVKTII